MAFSKSVFTASNSPFALPMSAVLMSSKPFSCSSVASGKNFLMSSLFILRSPFSFQFVLTVLSARLDSFSHSRANKKDLFYVCVQRRDRIDHRSFLIFLHEKTTETISSQWFYSKIFFKKSNVSSLSQAISVPSTKSKITVNPPAGHFPSTIRQ